MRRWVVERVLIPTMRLLERPGEKLWLGIALATVLAIVFAPTGGSTPTGGVNAPGSYHSATFATTQDNVKKPNPHPASHPLDTARLPEAAGPVPQDEFSVIH